MFKHTAQHDGHTFTRNSQGRKYTHCIVRVNNKAASRAWEEKQARKNYRASVKYMTEVANGLRRTEPTPPSEFHSSYGMDDPVKYAEYSAKLEEANANHIAEAKAWVALGEDGHAAKALEWFDALDLKMASNGVDYYRAGDEWCGRPDLATKAIAKHTKNGVRAIAVEATVVEHIPAKRAK